MCIRDSALIVRYVHTPNRIIGARRRVEDNHAAPHQRREGRTQHAQRPQRCKKPPRRTPAVCSGLFAHNASLQPAPASKHMPKQRAQTAARPSSPGVSLFEQASPARCKLTGTRPASCRTGSAKPLSKEAPSLWASLFPSKPALHVTNLPGFSADLSMQAILFSDKSATIPEHGRPPTELALQKDVYKRQPIIERIQT